MKNLLYVTFVLSFAVSMRAEAQVPFFKSETVYPTNNSSAYLMHWQANAANSGDRYSWLECTYGSRGVSSTSVYVIIKDHAGKEDVFGYNEQDQRLSSMSTRNPEWYVTPSAIINDTKFGQIRIDRVQGTYYHRDQNSVTGETNGIDRGFCVAIQAKPLGSVRTKF